MAKEEITKNEDGSFTFGFTSGFSAISFKNFLSNGGDFEYEGERYHVGGWGSSYDPSDEYPHRFIVAATKRS